MDHDMQGPVRTISFVSGDVDAAGQSVRLRIEADADNEPIDLRVAADDLPHLVNLLLQLGTRVPRRPSTGLLNTVEVMPLPLRAASLGMTDDREPLLLLDVGDTVLAFSMPADQMADIGRALVAMSGVSGTTGRA
jgi:hypothetical protein